MMSSVNIQSEFGEASKCSSRLLYMTNISQDIKVHQWLNILYYIMTKISSNLILPAARGTLQEGSIIVRGLINTHCTKTFA